MTKRATTEQLRKSRQTTVTVEVGGEPMEFVIAKIKVGQRKRLRVECVDELGYLDFYAASMLACEMCVVEPELSADDVDHLDADVFVELADEIAKHSGLKDIQQATTSDPEEGSAEHKQFPVDVDAVGGSELAGGGDEDPDSA